MERIKGLRGGKKADWRINHNDGFETTGNNLKKDRTSGRILQESFKWMVMVMIEGLLADYDWRINALEPLLMQESLEAAQRAATCSSNYNDAAEFDVT